jgi:phosphohistidine phosphatase
MKQLCLLRHAKSSWDDPGLGDRQRPLAPRGRKAARRLATWIAESDVRPRVVVCSPAVRTRQTLEAVLEALDGPTVEVDERVYHASSALLLERARALPDDEDAALIVGHNPGLADLCLMLARNGDRRDRVAAKLPTGALAILAADVERWSELAPESADLVELVLPRELA